MRALFGVAGNSITFTREVSKSSADAPAWLKSIGLDAYEYQCGRGVHVKQPTAETIGQNAAAAGIVLSVHAPYFINLANPERLEQNKKYVLDACRAARWMGARRIVLHSGTLMKRTRAKALEIAKHSLKEIVRCCDQAGFGDLTLCPETMGVVGQLGDLEEVLALCGLDERLTPCIDFGHLYARTAGALNGADAMRHILDRMEQALGEERAAAFHSHFSHIEFTPERGEERHLSFADSQGFGPDFAPLGEELARRGWGPTIICESAGTQSEDALSMKECYGAFLKGQENIPQP